jgi:iron complex outermembrane receptor protein
MKQNNNFTQAPCAGVHSLIRPDRIARIERIQRRYCGFRTARPDFPSGPQPPNGSPPTSVSKIAFCAAVALMLVMGSAAYAADGAVAVEGTASGGLLQASTGQSASDKDSTSESALGEIVVTARKHSERSVEVPLSVEAFSGEALEENRMDTVQDLVGTVPNLSFGSSLLSPGKDQVNLIIRGVGAESEGTPAVGTFVDGVYVPGLAFDTQFLDVDHVEVLRGPQGTLFGRNTEGGALNIVLRRPTEETTEYASLTYDNFNTFRGQESLSGALADRLFGSASIDLETSDGYLRNPVIARVNGAGPGTFSVPADNYKRQSGRVALRYVPDDSLEIYWSADASKFTGLSGLPGVPLAEVAQRQYVVTSAFQLDSVNKNAGSALNVNYHLDDMDLTSITGYRSVSTTLPFNFGGSAEYPDDIQDTRSYQHIWSQEVRLAHNQSNYNWLVGVYGYEESYVQDRFYQLPEVYAFPAGIFISAQNQNLTSTGYATFADFTYRPFPRMELDAGVRYSYDKVKSNLAIALNIPEILVIPYTTTSGDISSNEVSPNVSLKFGIVDDLNAYVRFSRGYKAGGFPLAPASANTDLPFAPERSNNYEAGIKGRLWGDGLDFDLAAYHIDIFNQQVSTIVYLNGNTSLPVASVGNAGRSKSEGFEAQIGEHPMKGLTLLLNAGLTDATYVHYIDADGTNRAGEQEPYVPRWTGQFSTTYRTPIGHDLDLELFGDYKYVGSLLSGSGVGIDLQFPVPHYQLFDARASLIRDRWQADLFVDNIANSFIYTRVWNAFFFNGPNPFGIVLPPRNIGARVSYRF